jgi:hypothetical protein
VVLLLFPSCSDEILDEINKNPNSPTDVPISLLLPQAMVSTIAGVAGHPAGTYASLFVEHTTNVHLNPRMPSDISGVFNTVYSVLNDLKVIIEKGSDGGSEEGQYEAVGVAKILYVYTLSVGTDLFGEMPHSEALQGSDIRQPKFDDQEEIYAFMLQTLDEAIADLSRGSIVGISSIDIIFQGDVEMWKKTAYALKARLHNRLSNIDGQGSAQSALDALAQAYSSGDEGLIFDKYLPGSSNDNPWTAYQKSQQLFAISTTILELMDSMTEPGNIDPRAEKWFTKIEGDFVGAPPGDAQTDLSHTVYSTPSPTEVLYDEAPQPVLTYDEMKFIEAEAYLRLPGNEAKANEAYEAAVVAAMRRVGISDEAIETYTGQGSVFPGPDGLTLELVIQQKNISFWLFQSLEAYNDYRRTGIPEMNNRFGTPHRIPYPNSEIDRNANTPSDINDVTIYTTPLWWQS